MTLFGACIIGLGAIGALYNSPLDGLLDLYRPVGRPDDQGFWDERWLRIDRD